MTRKDTAMTGEISLQGFVLPVGGIKEKCLAAVRNKIKRVLLPYQNQHDFEEVPKETKSLLEVVFVKDIKEVIENVFNERLSENGKLFEALLPKF
jgi:ATP-dependent Lon protease